MKKNIMKIFGDDYCFLYSIIFLIIFIYISLRIYKYYSNEGFTTRIREMYRPYFRNIRLIKDRYYTQIKNTFFSFIRKFGLN
jgi:hypothetical protein